MSAAAIIAEPSAAKPAAPRLGASPSGKLYALLFLLCLVAYGLPFNGATSWNTTSRFALTLGIVNEGTLFIDRYAALTGDKAEAGAHFASDKAPGMSFLALPVTYAGLAVIRRFVPEAQLLDPPAAEGESPRRTATYLALLWLANLGTGAVLSALGVCALFDLACRLGADWRGALFAALLFGFATPQWGWATAFYGHATCGALLILALWTIVRSAAIPPTGRSSGIGTAALAGLLLGLAVAVEMTAAPAAAMIASLGLWRIWSWPAEAITRTMAAAAIGAAVPLLGMAAYNAAVFGSPFSLGYGSAVGFEGLREGLFGVALPRLEIVLRILLGRGRGLVWLSPILLLFPWALRAGWKRGAGDAMLICAGVTIAFLLINSGFVYWTAGLSTGPRYIVPAMGFMALPFAFLWPSQAAWPRRALLALGALSLFANLAASANLMAKSAAGFVILHEVLIPFIEGGSRVIVLERLGLDHKLSFALYCAALGLLAWGLLLAAKRRGG